MTPRLKQSSPPLLFAVFWLGFTTVHAFFMLRGFWGSGAMFFLVPFYCIFFGVGMLMLRSGWTVAVLRRRLGTPTLMPLPPVQPGQMLVFAVEFDREWPRDARLAGELRWREVDSDGDGRTVLAEAPVTGMANPGVRGTSWQGRGIVPPRPAGAGRLRLELTLQPEGRKAGSGWSLDVPVTAAPDAPARPVQLTPQQARKVGRVMGGIAAVLLAVGGVWLWRTLDRDPRALFPLVFPAGLLLTAWIVYDLRASVPVALGAGPDPEAVRQRLQPLVAGIKRRVQVFFGVAVGAFVADLLGLLDRF